ncbi:MAG TPA: DUF4337 family protein, partial [Candidatus Lustribacter sp.]
FFTAILAVLAALGTLYSHHRSIGALSLRNQAILVTAKASDQYSYYQTKQLKIALYQALLAADGSSSPARVRTLRSAMETEQRSSLAVFAQAKQLEREAADDQSHAESLLASFETLEIATTLFEISIAFASIAALTDARIALVAGAVLSAIGLVLGIFGYLQAH